MKNLFLFTFCFVFLGTIVKSQNFSASSVQQPTCFGSCNGSVTFTTSNVTGPFNMVMTNSASCPNSTVSTSSSSAITVSSVCACSSDYTVSIYTGTILVGVEYVQFPVTATAALAVNPYSISPATCSGCCNGKVYVSWTGGSTQINSPTVTIDGTVVTTYTPATGLCAGNHTVCAKDDSQCLVCNTFSVPVQITTAINKEHIALSFVIYPQPATDLINIESAINAEIRLYDLNGKELPAFRTGIRNGSNALNVSELENGLYFIQIDAPNGERYMKKIFKASN